MLFHISAEPGIEVFEPRPSQYTSEPVVWAITAERLHNYLVPRDCPRVTPARVELIDYPIAELLKRGIELRFVPDLWPLRDAVVESTLQFSIIRMRSAARANDT